MKTWNCFWSTLQYKSMKYKKRTLLHVQQKCLVRMQLQKWTALMVIPRIKGIILHTRLHITTDFLLSFLKCLKYILRSYSSFWKHSQTHIRKIKSMTSYISIYDIFRKKSSKPFLLFLPIFMACSEI